MYSSKNLSPMWNVEQFLDSNTICLQYCLIFLIFENMNTVKQSQI